MVRLEWGIKLRETTNAVRPLEFTLTQLEFQIDKNFRSISFLSDGEVTPNLLPPDVLHNILTNVILSLPEGSNLIVGSQFADLSWYYQNVKAALLADVNSFFYWL